MRVRTIFMVGAFVGGVIELGALGCTSDSVTNGETNVPGEAGTPDGSGETTEDDASADAGGELREDDASVGCNALSLTDAPSVPETKASRQFTPSSTPIPDGTYVLTKWEDARDNPPIRTPLQACALERKLQICILPQRRRRQARDRHVHG